MNSKKMKIIIGSILLILLSGISLAAEPIQQGDLPIFAEEYKSFKKLTVQYDGLCQDLPDDKGTPSSLDSYNRVWCLNSDGSTDAMTGCVVQFYDNKGNELRVDRIKPGKTTQPMPDGTAYWQRFNCYDVDFTCTDFQSEGCGSSGQSVSCPDDQMLRVRTCSENAPDYDAYLGEIVTERCIEWYSCEYQDDECDYSAGVWSTCKGGVQSRTINEEDCTTWTDYQACTVDCVNPDGKSGYIYCNGGVEYICDYGIWKNNGECSVSNTGGTTTTTTEPEPTTYTTTLTAGAPSAWYSSESEKVYSQIQINNTDNDMEDTYLIEMQVVPSGNKPFAVVSSQGYCDESEKGNVHKNFMIRKGESVTISLEVARSNLQGDGEYDVYLLTRHKCYVDLTKDEKALGDEYQLVGPIPGYKLVGTVLVGEAGSVAWEEANAGISDWVAEYGKIFGISLMLLGLISWFWISWYCAIPIVVGAALVVWQAFL